MILSGCSTYTSLVDLEFAPVPPNTIKIDHNLYIYSLPTKAEWISIAKKYSSVLNNVESGSTLNFKKNNRDTLEISDLEKIKNQSPFIHLFGNVAEMVQEPNLAMGSSYKDSLTQEIIWDGQEYTKPEDWLGFRGVCRYMTYEEYLNYLSSWQN